MGREGTELISALLKRPAFGKDYALKDQLANASGGIPGHISEGFGQLTDRHFARYLGIARGSSQEVRGHLQVAWRRSHITRDELQTADRLYDELCSMITGFVAHLRECDYKHRW